MMPDEQIGVMKATDHTTHHVELEIGRQVPPESSEAGEQLLTTGLPRDAELAFVDHVNLDIVAFLHDQRLDHCGGQTDGQPVAPSGSPHDALHG